MLLSRVLKRRMTIKSLAFLLSVFSIDYFQTAQKMAASYDAAIFKI